VIVSQESAEDVIRGELVTIPAGHLVHAVRPAGFTAAVTAFLGTKSAWPRQWRA
jgi:pimeloyl-ACP methyl ester carboxylesterase